MTMLWRHSNTLPTCRSPLGGQETFRIARDVEENVFSCQSCLVYVSSACWEGERAFDTPTLTRARLGDVEILLSMAVWRTNERLTGGRTDGRTTGQGWGGAWWNQRHKSSMVELCIMRHISVRLKLHGWYFCRLFGDCQYSMHRPMTKQSGSRRVFNKQHAGIKVALYCNIEVYKSITPIDSIEIVYNSLLLYAANTKALEQYHVWSWCQFD